MDQLDFNKLWQNFVGTITNHYADFSGRVGRAQFWCYVIAYFVIGFAVSIIGEILFLHGGLRALYALALILPSMGITARRMQDTGRSGAWAFLLLLPYALVIFSALLAIITVLTFGIGAILYAFLPIVSLISLAAIAVLIYFCAQPGETAANAYGPPPPAWTPNRDAAPTPPPPAAS